MENFFQDMFSSNYRRDPQKEAIYDYCRDVRYTWADMHDRAIHLIRFCTHELGLKKGDRVAFLCPSDVAMISMFHASLKTGIIIVVYNQRLKSDDLAAMFKNESPSALFYMANTEEKALEVLKLAGSSAKTICIDEKAHADYWLHDVLNTFYPAVVPVELDMEDPAILVHTGGTTGVPKAAILSYRNIFMNIIIEMKDMGISRYDTIYTSMPMFHTGGWNTFSLVVMFAGGRLILDKSFSADTFYKVLEQEKLTAFMGVEMMFKLIAHDPRFKETDLSGLRYVIAGGSPVEKSIMDAYMNRGIRFFNGFGSTESGANNATVSFDCTLEEAQAKWDAIGKPLSFNYFRVVDENGNDVARGKQGELVTRGGVLFSGYWNNPEATAAAVRDGWFHTGDVAYVDEDGDYHICGRIKHMYISGGENVFPAQIETVLQRFPGLAEVFVKGVPDAEWGEVGKAYVIMRPGVEFDEAAFRAFAKENLSTIKRPHYVQLVDFIPKTVMGKVDVNQVEELYER